MRRRGLIELLPLDPEPETTLHRLRKEQREAQHRNLAIMQNNEKQDHGQEQNEQRGGRNGNNGKNLAPRPFIQPDDPFMLLDYHLQLFSRLSEDHPFRQTTLN